MSLGPTQGLPFTPSPFALPPPPPLSTVAVNPFSLLHHSPFAAHFLLLPPPPPPLYSLPAYHVPLPFYSSSAPFSLPPQMSYPVPGLLTHSPAVPLPGLFRSPLLPSPLFSSSSSSGAASDSGYSTSFTPRSRDSKQFSSEAVEILGEWYRRHYLDPYLSDSDLSTLCSLTGLTVKQVRKWFANKRERTNNTLKNNNGIHPKTRKRIERNLCRSRDFS